MTCLSFVGCSGKKESIDEGILEDAKELSTIYVDQLLEGQYAELTEEEISQMANMPDFYLNNNIVQMGLPMEADSFLGMLKAWMSAEDECGQYQSHDDFEITQKGDQIIASATAEFAKVDEETGEEISKRTADIVFTYDRELWLESMDISAKYSNGEILSKAGLNTLLGMGTVFAVLILLAFIISLMKYIPMFMNGMQKKQPVKTETSREVQSVEAVDLTDDLELVAVITAAIAASEGTSSDGFVVRSIRRRPSNNWR